MTIFWSLVIVSDYFLVFGNCLTIQDRYLGMLRMSSSYERIVIAETFDQFLELKASVDLHCQLTNRLKVKKANHKLLNETTYKDI